MERDVKLLESTKDASQFRVSERSGSNSQGLMKCTADSLVLSPTSTSEALPSSAVIASEGAADASVPSAFGEDSPSRDTKEVLETGVRERIVQTSGSCIPDMAEIVQEEITPDCGLSSAASDLPRDPERIGSVLACEDPIEPVSTTDRSGLICDKDDAKTQQLEAAVAKLGAYFGKGHYLRGPANFDGWCIPHALRLRGGAGAASETNTNGTANGTSGWGQSPGGSGSGGGPAWNQPPPTSSSGGAQQGQPGAGGVPWGAQAGGAVSGASSATSWAQAAGKGLPQNAVNAPPGAPNAQNSGSGGAVGGPPTPSNAPPVAPGNPAGQPGVNPPQGGGSGDSNQQKRELEKLREALYATDGWGGNHVNQDSDWSVPPSPPKSPGSESHQSWKATPHSTGTELWETNLRNGGVPAPRPPEMSASVKPPWGHRGSSNEFGGQWDPEDDNVDAGSSWNTPPPSGGSNQWNSGVGSGPGGAGPGMWGSKDKSGVDWSNPGAGPNVGSSGWGAQNVGNRWGGPGAGPKPPAPGGMPGAPWVSKGWADENTPPGGKPDDGSGLWGMKRNDSMGRGMEGPGMSMPPGVRPSAGRGWAEGGSDPSGAGRWGAPPSSPPNMGPGGWGQKPKSGMGWGDSGDMMGSGGGWGRDQDQQKKDLWKSNYGMFKNETGMGMGRDMDDMNMVGHGYPGGPRDPMGDPNVGGMGMPPGGSGPGGWPSGGPGRMDEHHGMGAGFGGGPGGYGGMGMHGDAGRGPGASFPAQMQQNVPFMAGQARGGVRPGAPSNQQLQVLVNQIHMAVQAGHLNPQILNQKLSSQTLFLLHELLNQIKQLQQLTQQHQALQHSHMRGPSQSQNLLQVSVKITQTKQQIQNLQNQINAQQGIFTKNQPGGGGGAPGMMMGGPGGDASGFHKFPGQGGMGLGVGMGGAGGNPDVSGFSSMMGSMNLGPGSGGMGGEGLVGAGAMGGMPGSALDHAGMAPPSSSRLFNDWRFGASGTSAAPAMMLGAPTDGTWATPAAKVDNGGWPDSTGASASSGSATGTTNQLATSTAGGWSTGTGASSGGSGSGNYNMPDVPEFEPGKPWKGNQLMKNIEDDPTITPGSVKRSPLSVAGIKETDLSMKSASSSSTSTTDTKTGAGSSSANGAGGWSYGSNRSSWLLLNNLNQSIDSSTLKTLCSQHGQLTSFQLMMHQGMALICYKSYEEAAKAQASLNNCVLGSTSIRAEFVSEGDVQSFLGGSGQGGQVQGPPPQTSWSNATTSQASTMSRGHEATWGQPGLSSWSGGSNPSALWDSGDPSHSYLPENLI